jgi:hypothetical protein
MKSWIQSLMDACLNVFCTNAIYKHIYHGEYKTCTSCLNDIKTFCQQNWKRNNNNNNSYTTCKFVTTCCDENVICDYMIILFYL